MTKRIVVYYSTILGMDIVLPLLNAVELQLFEAQLTGFYR